MQYSGSSYQPGWGLVETGGWSVQQGSQDVIEFSADGDNWEIIHDPMPGLQTKSLFITERERKA